MTLTAFKLMKPVNLRPFHDPLQDNVGTALMDPALGAWGYAHFFKYALSPISCARSITWVKVQNQLHYIRTSCCKIIDLIYFKKLTWEKLAGGQPYLKITCQLLMKQSSCPEGERGVLHQGLEENLYIRQESLLTTRGVLGCWEGCLSTTNDQCPNLQYLMILSDK